MATAAEKGDTSIDAEGKEHNIHMPKGTMKTAIKYFEEKNYEELAKFPLWANQKYDEEDEIEVKK